MPDRLKLLLYAMLGVVPLQAGAQAPAEPAPVSNAQMAALGPIYPAVRGADRRIVQLGYNAPHARYIGRHWEAMDRSGLDGTGYYVKFPDPDDERENLSSEYRTSMRLFDGRTRWDPAWFEEPLAAMRSAEFRNLTDNQLMAWVTPANFDWFDDDAWATVLHNTRLLAEFGRATGNTSGINFDAEQYGPHLWQHSTLDTDEDFATTAAEVRERGESWARTLGEAWPDAEIFMFWISDYCKPGLGAAEDPVRAGDNTGLFLAFFEGMLAGMHERTTVWEGNEHAYMFGSPGSFPRNAVRVRANLAAALTPDLRRRFYAHVRGSHGVYLDAYLNEEGTQYGISKFGKSASDLLYRNLLTALSTSDGVVWIWAEDGVFFDRASTGPEADRPVGYAGDRITQPRWDERFRHFDAALDWARSPHARLAEHLPAIEGAFADEAMIGAHDMQPAESAAAVDGEGWDSGGLPGGWWSWKYDDDPGSFHHDRAVGRGDNASLRMDGIARGGCFGMNLPITPQRTLLVRAFVKTEGDTVPQMTIRWRHPGEAFEMGGEDVGVAFEAEAEADAEGWRRAFAVVTAPEQVSSAVLLLSATGEPGSRVWFDDAQAWDFTDGPARLWEAEAPRRTASR
ncbi:hypothetical protein [Phycisphaera mikurensis]|uniref:Uncharacterized protein n=1 Tax=Phycisphaera mikurensis (strain NBRC 102666 / KCTC 22515 / FYK2301M01) TaxID=1142394 RepID=I0ICS8_PHYMF|nr:hypothetical protein [Phycisphaera mikurensis]MBB6443313.1 hypothetical protein [Phycisphaera mikurensis]BAM03066.1 hypothetical protein PSMK_09070 [Phycisphaera mikurensis NBRC 102666]